MYLYAQIGSLTPLIKPYTLDFMVADKHLFKPNTLGWYIEDGKFVIFDVDAKGTVSKFGCFHTGADAMQALFIHASAEAAEHCRLSAYPSMACSHKYTKDEFERDIAALGDIKIVDMQRYQPFVYGYYHDTNGYYCVFRNNASGVPVPTVYTACESDALTILRYMIQHFTVGTFN